MKNSAKGTLHSSSKWGFFFNYSNVSRRGDDYMCKKSLSYTAFVIHLTECCLVSSNATFMFITPSIYYRHHGSLGLAKNSIQHLDLGLELHYSTSLPICSIPINWVHTTLNHPHCSLTVFGVGTYFPFPHIIEKNLEWFQFIFLQ